MFHSINLFLKLASLSCLVLFLSGCPGRTGIKDMNYAAGAETAVIALLNSDMRGNARVKFLGIDLETERLTGKYFTVDMKRDAKTPAFYLKEVPAGNYFQLKVTASSRLGINRYVLDTCYNGVNEVFELKAGRVNEVRTDKLIKGDDIVATELADILKEWPNISAPVYQAKLMGYVIGSRRLCAQRSVDEGKKIRIFAEKPQ